MAVSNDLPFRERSAGFLANHLARQFHQALAARIAPLGLAPAQFMVLVELWAEPGLTQGELVRRLDVEQATMANTLARMARDGLIERRPVEGDRRARGVFPTARAAALEQPAKARAEQVNAVALAGLDPDERDSLLALIRKASAGLSAARKAPS